MARWRWRAQGSVRLAEGRLEEDQAGALSVQGRAVEGGPLTQRAPRPCQGAGARGARAHHARLSDGDGRPPPRRRGREGRHPRVCVCRAQRVGLPLQVRVGDAAWRAGRGPLWLGDGQLPARQAVPAADQRAGWHHRPRRRLGADRVRDGGPKWAGGVHEDAQLRQPYALDLHQVAPRLRAGRGSSAGPRAARAEAGRERATCPTPMHANGQQDGIQGSGFDRRRRLQAVRQADPEALPADALPLLELLLRRHIPAAAARQCLRLFLHVRPHRSHRAARQTARRLRGAVDERRGH
mmetsp:Transcript_32799/g.76573  ORF Transcript_32799/g.76573 Transcript_32799/m.76573 type:complete len:295 (-) Transcript_32799:357-1241(-)